MAMASLSVVKFPAVVCTLDPCRTSDSQDAGSPVLVDERTPRDSGITGGGSASGFEAESIGGWRRDANNSR
jgi:hypothetical protein